MIFASVNGRIRLCHRSFVFDPGPHHVYASAKDVCWPGDQLLKSVGLQCLNPWIVRCAMVADVEVPHDNTVTVLWYYLLQDLRQVNIVSASVDADDSCVGRGQNRYLEVLLDDVSCQSSFSSFVVSGQPFSSSNINCV